MRRGIETDFHLDMLVLINKNNVDFNDTSRAYCFKITSAALLQILSKILVAFSKLLWCAFLCLAYTTAYCQLLEQPCDNIELMRLLEVSSFALNRQQYDSALHYANRYLTENTYGYSNSTAHLSIACASLALGKQSGKDSLALEGSALVHLREIIFSRNVSAKDYMQAEKMMDELPAYKKRVNKYICFYPEKEPKWILVEASGVRFYFQDTMQISGFVNGYVTRRALLCKRIRQIFNIKNDLTLSIFVWSDIAFAERLLGSPLAFASPQSYTCNISLGSSPSHEITHVMSYWANDDRPASLSRFMSEGLAVAFDGLGDIKKKVDDAKEAVMRSGYCSVAEIWQNEQTVDPEILYPIAGATVAYFHRKLSRALFLKLVKCQRIDEAQDAIGPEGFKQVIGKVDSMIGFK